MMLANVEIKTQVIEKKPISIDRIHLRPASFEDVEELTKMLNACAINQTGKPNMNEKMLHSEWTTPNFDVRDNTRVATNSKGRIVGYVEVWDTDPLPVRNWVWARVHPDHEGLGIGSKLMDWADQKLHITATRVPKDLQVSYSSSALSTYKPTIEFLEDRGMKLVRHFWRMVTDLTETPPQPKWPKGITLKTAAELNDLRKVYEAFKDAFRDHWGYVEQPEDDMIEEWEHWMETDVHADPNYWYLAMDGDEIAGICICRKESYEDPDMGWVNILGVRRPWRKLGLGLALLHHSFGEFYLLGKSRVGLGVDAASLTGATRLYERAGMYIWRESQSYEKVIRPGRDISNQG